MINKEPVYKAMTRPAMIFGIPLMPFMLVCSIFALIGVYTEIFMALLGDRKSVV